MTEHNIPCPNNCGNTYDPWYSKRQGKNQQYPYKSCYSCKQERTSGGESSEQLERILKLLTIIYKKLFPNTPETPQNALGAPQTEDTAPSTTPPFPEPQMPNSPSDDEVDINDIPA